MPCAGSGVGETSGEEGPERTRDVSAARVADRVEPGPALLVQESLRIFHRSRLAEVVPEYRDVDVLGEALNQTEGLRQGCAAVEEQTGSSGRSFPIEGIQGPADPEVLLDVADRGAEPISGCQKQIEAVARR